jgi:hypothetical protein
MACSITPQCFQNRQVKRERRIEWVVRGTSIGILFSAALVGGLTGNIVGALGFGVATMHAAESAFIKWMHTRKPRTS